MKNASKPMAPDDLLYAFLLLIYSLHTAISFTEKSCENQIKIEVNHKFKFVYTIYFTHPSCKDSLKSSGIKKHLGSGWNVSCTGIVAYGDRNPHAFCVSAFSGICLYISSKF